MRYLLPLLGLVVFPLGVGHAGEASPYYDPNALIVNVSETDLNLALQDLWSTMGPRFQGTKEIASSARGLSYDGRLSTPVIDLRGGSNATIDLALLEARIRVDSVEHKLLGRRVRCEELGADLEEGRSLDMSLDLSFLVEERDVRIVPREVEVPNAKGAFKLHKPERCKRNLIPTFMLWWIAKPFLQKQFNRLDEKLLLGAERGVEQLEDEDGAILHKRVDIEGQELFVYPRVMGTDHDALWIAAAASSDEHRPDDPTRRPPEALGPTDERSFLAVSETTLNAILERVYLAWSKPASQPHGNVRKLFRSTEMLTLVPGLREIEDRQNLRWAVRFTATPRIDVGRLGELATPDAAQRFSPFAWPSIAELPLITLRTRGIEIEFTRSGETEESVGALVIDSGVVSAVPYANRLGGISLHVVSNEWRVSSRGIEFEEQLLAATLQELIFAELFETRYEPLARSALTVGPIRFEPSGFSTVDDYLVIDLVRLPPVLPAPTRTDSPRASR